MKYFRNLTTFRTGGPVGNFVEVGNESEIKAASAFAKKNNLKIFILGGGSDILVNDKGFYGLVIKYIGKDINYDKSGEVTAEAGVIWDDLVADTVNKNLQGLECLSGIPGTVGASPIQNIGAYGQEVKDTFFKLRAYDFKEG
jgi:UDP-N-acetylmuramate dehydrogenase